MAITYQNAGVDIDQADALIDDFKTLAKSTLTPLSRAGIGGFASLCGLPKGMREPVLVSGTDGVGTKLKVAFEANRHDTIGIDLVAMCVNDILTVGAKPLFFLDYFASSKLQPDVAKAVVSGIAVGCRQAGCALLGGETAELPGMYAEGEYDLAGFCVGVAEADALIQGQYVEPEDVVIGIASSGLHSNGFSLARKVLQPRFRLDETLEGRQLQDWLLTPTLIYARVVELIAPLSHALCHITGGGIPGNLPRVLPNGARAVIEARAWARPAIFDVIQREGPVNEDEMWRVFNMGLGMLAVTSAQHADQILKSCAQVNLEASIVGHIEASQSGSTAEVLLV